MSNHLIDRERVSIIAEVEGLSNRFDNGGKREIILKVSIILDESELSDDLLGQRYTATLQKERRKKP